MYLLYSTVCLCALCIRIDYIIIKLWQNPIFTNIKQSNVALLWKICILHNDFNASCLANGLHKLGLVTNNIVGKSYLWLDCPRYDFSFYLLSQNNHRQSENLAHVRINVCNHSVWSFNFKLEVNLPLLGVKCLNKMELTCRCGAGGSHTIDHVNRPNKSFCHLRKKFLKIFSLFDKYTIKLFFQTILISDLPLA